MSLLEKFINLFLHSAKDIETLEISSNDTFVVVSNTALGDTLLSTPAIKSLKKSFPNNKIIAVLKSSYTPLFNNFKYIDEIIEYDGKYKNFFTAIFKLRNCSPKTTFILHSNGPQDIQLSILSGGEYVLKHPTKSYLKKYLSFDFPKKNQHTIEDRLDLVRKIGGNIIDTKIEIGDILNNQFLEFKDYIGFQIGAANIYKMWPMDRFIGLAKKLLADGEKIIIVGTKNESKLAKKLIDELNNQNIINMCGKTDIVKLANVVNNLKMLITNDTGTMHLAITLQTPTISLFSATNSKGIGPYQDSNIHKIIQKDGSFIQKFPKKERNNSAMKLIEVDEVYEVYKDLREKI